MLGVFSAGACFGVLLALMITMVAYCLWDDQD